MTGAATGGWIVVTIVATTVGTSAVTGAMTGAMTVGTGGTTAIDGMTVTAAATVGIGTATIGTATEGTGIGGIVTVIGPKAEIEVDTQKTVIVTKVAKMERTEMRLLPKRERPKKTRPRRLRMTRLPRPCPNCSEISSSNWRMSSRRGWTSSGS